MGRKTTRQRQNHQDQFTARERLQKLEIDILVMGTVCRTGIPGFIIGNTAERVLDAVDRSVLTVKPEGFVSPVAPLISAKEG